MASALNVVQTSHSYGDLMLLMKHAELQQVCASLENLLPFFPILPENLGTARLVVDFDRWWTGEESVNVLLEAAGQGTHVLCPIFI
ncbi:hypothetical protein ES319_A09G141800v1 [Gossypium barbadense]|uniref:Uncharacterized protein n=1 Tax=Gossypium barbadense TaxID=3634 RepID=A0A5J5UF12_GOSBA|nr:hypothetical protein ES319_A09G141800v1 [Gossypium barbadense]